MASVAEPISRSSVRARESRYQSAITLAATICLLYALVGLLVPPALSHDAAWGMQEWRSLVAGGPMDSITSPDPSDISRDRVSRVTWWSPGQYMIPGVLTLLGLRVGTAITITNSCFLLSCLLGWVYVAKYFALGPRLALVVVVFMGTFRYSTASFGFYGGEILLQGLAPWLLLAGCQMPSLGAFRAAGLTCLIILIAFFAKLTGLMVASVALLAGGIEVFVRGRRITPGMLGTAAGAAIAFGFLYVVWFSRGTTPATGMGWSFRPGNVFYAVVAPWGAGISWGDVMGSLLFNSRHPILANPLETGNLLGMAWLLLPPAVVFAIVILARLRSGPSNPLLRRLLLIAGSFYVFSAIAMSVLLLRGGDISLEDRHLRAAGMLLFVSALAAVEHLPRRSVRRFGVMSLCALMSLLGCALYAYRVLSTRPESVDPYSRIYQPNVDRGAIEFAKLAFAREGRDAVFVVPSPEIACAFPPLARIVSNHLQYETEEVISSRRYSGRARGGLYVIMQTAIAETAKGHLLLGEYVDYPHDQWKKHRFGATTVFVQGEP